MAIPLKNIIFDKISQEGSLTDIELSKALAKKGYVLAEIQQIIARFRDPRFDQSCLDD